MRLPVKSIGASGCHNWWGNRANFRRVTCVDDSVQPLLIIVPAGGLLVFTFVTLANPFAARARGVQVFYIRLGFMQRVLVLRWHVLGILAINSVAALPGLDALNSSQYGLYSFLILLGTVVMIMLPMRYHFFEEGVAVGSGGLREWGEFSSYHYTAAGARLNPSGSGRGLMLYLTDVQRRALHPTLERYLGGQRGRTGARPRGER